MAMLLLSLTKLSPYFSIFLPALVQNAQEYLVQSEVFKLWSDICKSWLYYSTVCNDTSLKIVCGMNISLDSFFLYGKISSV